VGAGLYLISFPPTRNTNVEELACYDAAYRNVRAQLPRSDAEFSSNLDLLPWHHTTGGFRTFPSPSQTLQGLIGFGSP
jgi:hypothetical protein